MEVKVLKKTVRAVLRGKANLLTSKKRQQVSVQVHPRNRWLSRDHLTRFIQMSAARRCRRLGQRPKQRLEPDRLQPSHIPAHAEEAAGRVQPHGPVQDHHSETARHRGGRGLYSCQTWWVPIVAQLQKHKHKPVICDVTKGTFSYCFAES